MTNAQEKILEDLRFEIQREELLTKLSRARAIRKATEADERKRDEGPEAPQAQEATKAIAAPAHTEQPNEEKPNEEKPNEEKPEAWRYASDRLRAAIQAYEEMSQVQRNSVEEFNRARDKRRAQKTKADIAKYKEIEEQALQQLLKDQKILDACKKERNEALREYQKIKSEVHGF